MWTALALLVYVLTTHIRRERRSPTVAIAWVMGLALLPYVTLPLYLLFGQRKIKANPTVTMIRTHSDIHWAAALLESFGLTLPSPTHVRFHHDGAKARDALWDVFDSAQQRLDVSTFLIGDDTFGIEALERLTQRARAGVRVRLLIDGFGIWSAPHRKLRELKKAGGEVAVFRPLLRGWRMGPRNLRNHRKLTIADDARLWAGGRNLAGEYFVGLKGKSPWIDLSFDLNGAVVGVAASQFESDWASAGGRRPQRLPDTVASTTGNPAQFLPSGPDQSDDTAQLLLLDACFRARHRFIAVSPYFVPDPGLLTAMRVAARRGVKVTLVLPLKSNHRLADFVRHRAMRELVEAGAEIRLLPTMVHAKAVVIDDTLALCGSINLDLRSLLLNYEAAIVFYGAPEIEWLRQWVEDLAAQGTRFETSPPGLLRDVAEGLLLMIAFQL